MPETISETFDVCDNVIDGDERLNPNITIQTGFSSFRCQNETRSNLPNLADSLHGLRGRMYMSVYKETGLSYLTCTENQIFVISILQVFVKLREQAQPAEIQA